MSICTHDPAAKCGCWIDDAGTVRRHAFRFLAGDRVHWAGTLGITGTVKRGGENLYVDWDAVPMTAFPVNFEIRHIEG